MENCERLLTAGADEIRADLIAGILEQEGIPFYMKTPGAGTVYNSGILSGICIYVAAAGYERAIELVNAYLS